MTHRTQFGGDELQEKAEDVQTETAYRNAALYSGRDLIQHGKQDVLGVLTFSESLEMNLYDIYFHFHFTIKIINIKSLSSLYKDVTLLDISKPRHTINYFVCLGLLISGISDWIDIWMCLKN